MITRKCAQTAGADISNNINVHVYISHTHTHTSSLTADVAAAGRAVDVVEPVAIHETVRERESNVHGVRVLQYTKDKRSTQLN